MALVVAAAASFVVLVLVTLGWTLAVVPLHRLWCSYSSHLAWNLSSSPLLRACWNRSP